MKLLQNSKISVKLPLTIGFVLLLAIGAGLFGILTLNHASATYAKVVEVDLANEQKVSEMLADFKTQVQEWKNVLLRARNPEDQDRHRKAFREQEAAISKLAKELESSLPPGESHELITKFIQAHADMGRGYRDGFAAFQNANYDSEVGDRAVQGVDRAPSELLDKAIAIIKANSAAAITRAKAESRRAIWISLGLMAIAGVLGVSGALLISRAITRPIEQAVKVAKTVAAGDLTSRIQVDSKDEIGELLLSLKEMNDSLAGIVATVRTGSESILTGSTQISAGNMDLSQRTEAQASSLQQTAASMEQLTSTVKQNADNARQANDQAMSASDIAAQGGASASEVAKTMDAISESSHRIVDIISVIDGIAFQTNILALNAAVEAARAGEHGRGFAVVASEVRTLAQRSAAAAKEIKSLIDDSVAQVRDGSAQVAAASRTMEAIVSSVQRVTAIMGDITQATVEQTSGIEQVNIAVSQLDQTTQQNAALVEEAAAAAASLQDQARTLSEAVSVFRLTEDSRSVARARLLPV